jgi:hypothetical protein
MSDATGFEDAIESNEWVKRINDTIAEDYFKSYEHRHFSDIQEIGSGSLGKVYRASWKNSQKYLALKSFYDLNNTIAKEIIYEVIKSIMHIYDTYSVYRNLTFFIFYDLV